MARDQGDAPVIDGGIVRLLPTERMDLTEEDVMSLTVDEQAALITDALPDVQIMSRVESFATAWAIRYRARVPVVTSLADQRVG